MFLDAGSHADFFGNDRRQQSLSDDDDDSALKVLECLACLIRWHAISAAAHFFHNKTRIRRQGRGRIDFHEFLWLLTLTKGENLHSVLAKMKVIDEDGKMAEPDPFAQDVWSSNVSGVCDVVGAKINRNIEYDTTTNSNPGLFCFSR